jgi:hypothetical protein
MRRELLLHLFTLKDTHIACGTPQDEKSARCRDCRCKTQHSQKTNIYAPHWNSNPQSQQANGLRSTSTYALGYGYIEARPDTTQQSGQTPDKEVEIKNITVCQRLHWNRYDWNVISPDCLAHYKGSLFRADSLARYLLQCAQVSNVVAMDKTVVGLNVATRSLQCIPRQMLVCCVVSV